MHAVKLYPAGATTHSDAGVTAVKHCYPALAAMERLGLPLCVHGEVTDPEIDVFDREQFFIERELIPLRRDFPALRVVFEHITTQEAADYVREAQDGIGATITAHHLLYNRNALFRGGCDPLVLPAGAQARTPPAGPARSRDLRQSAFFLGTDSAPHAKRDKEADCGCAAVTPRCMRWSSMPPPSIAPARWRGWKASPVILAPTTIDCRAIRGSITLQRVRQDIPTALPYGELELVPLAAGETLDWSLSTTGSH